MRVANVSLLLALVVPLVAGWSKEGEDEIAAHEPDPSATFYDILGVSRSASQEDINRAYRKKSRSLHPDKVKQQLKADRARAQAGGAGASSSSSPSSPPSASEVKAAVKRASERQARLSLIANILRGPSRERYDHFLGHGFPLWKGTDYYYSRYRPGLGTVVFGLFLMGGGALHYLILYMSWKRQKEFVERYVRFARETAWGSSGLGAIPGIDAAMGADDDDNTPPPPVQPLNRKQRRMQDKENRRDDGSGRAKKRGRKPATAAAAAAAASQESGGPVPTGARKRVVAENGKVLVVDSQGAVFLEGEDDDGNVNEFLLDPNELRQPTFYDTAVVRIPLWFLGLGLNRFRCKDEAETTDSEDGADDSDAPQRTPSTDSTGDDFELLDKSTDSLAKVKASGPCTQQQGSRPHKRKNRKR
ncbi:hypothetical protein L249_6928 [Ophiocordyceps polyrhachis-furcata BCC 54312]|uniref:J domain-containing protein n=1 Tax=Ophiocordyceps polyrhachis-furcata BCC 54312 TaxID=1330021 RepID=A0A367LLC3_9HYPO|nr:hypothetical protein L249_6928 [Ophiocordyceps polyrhachis-furcata BCC 54312]